MKEQTIINYREFVRHVGRYLSPGVVELSNGLVVSISRGDNERDMDKDSGRGEGVDKGGNGGAWPKAVVTSMKPLIVEKTVYGSQKTAYGCGCKYVGKKLCPKHGRN